VGWASFLSLIIDIRQLAYSSKINPKERKDLLKHSNVSLTDLGLHTAEEDIRRFVQNRRNSVLETLQGQDHCRTPELFYLSLVLKQFGILSEK
jgi:hypothetical protein